jgi:hypothetical protein
LRVVVYRSLPRGGLKQLGIGAGYGCESPRVSGDTLHMSPATRQSLGQLLLREAERPGDQGHGTTVQSAIDRRTLHGLDRPHL